jgi:hypothetical protein
MCGTPLGIHRGDAGSERDYRSSGPQREAW